MQLLSLIARYKQDPALINDIKGLLNDVDINYRDKDGDTFLHAAVQEGHQDIVKLLLDVPYIDPKIKNNQGDTPLDIAVRSGNQIIIGELQKYSGLGSSNQQVSSVEQQPSTQQKRTNSEEVESEDSNPKKQKTSSTDVQPMGVDQDTSSRKRSYEDEENPLQGKRPKLSTYSNSQQSSDIQENRKPTGLLTSYHGIAYQVQWMMVVALEAQERLNSKKSGDFKFKTIDLKTEDPDAGKFDDLVWRYETDQPNSYEWNFLQAKHKLNKEEKITLKELLKPKQKEDSLKSNEKDKRPFALEKYFLSYRDEIKKKYNGKVNKLIIATNIDFDNDLRSSLEPLKENIPILDFIKEENGQEAENWKFKDDFPHQKEIRKQLESTYDSIKLVKELLKDPVTEESPLGAYFYDLKKSGIIDISGKFHSNFIDNDDGLSEKAKKFREFILKIGFKDRRGSLNSDFKLADPKGIAEEIASLTKNSGKDIIKIERRKKIIQNNIDKLADYVLVEDEQDKGKIRFSRVFWEEDDAKLPGNLKDFRSKLKANFINLELIDKNDNGSQIYEKLRKYHFTITGESKDTGKKFTTCKERLISEKDFWEAMGRFYKFNINEILPSKDLPEKSLSEIKNEIEEFFERLTFVVNYPQETLDEFIKKKCSWFVGFETDYVAYEFQAKIANALNLEAKEFISTAEKVDNFFKEAKDRLNSLVLIGPTLLYKAQIEEYDVKFQESCIKELFKYKDNEKSYNFLDSDKKVLSLVTEQNDLTAIKVYQAIGQYQEQGGYIFMGLRSVLRMKDHVLSVFGERDLLIIECDYTNKDVQGLYSSLKSKLNGNKQIILITKENDLLAGELKRKKDDSLAGKLKGGFRDRYIETRDEKNSLTDLTIESQEELLKEGKVIFQGEEVSLGKLVDDGSKHLIDGEVLSKLINHEKVKIGKALIDSKYEDIKDYYIPRTFNRQVKIKEGLKEKESEFLVTDSNQFDKSELQKDQDIVLISDTGEGFKDLRDNHEEHSIHWLKQEGDDLIWQQSYGALSKLRDFIDTNEQAIQEYKPEKIIDIKDRVVIISAEPGMGKSTVLNPLALKTKDSLWVIRINLLDYSTELKRETEKKTKLNKAEAIKFLYRIVGFQLFQEQKEETTEKKEKREQTIEKVLSAITVKDSEIILDRKSTQDLDLLEIGLFNNFYNQGKIVLLFDGFDEISPDYTEKVIELLQVLKNSKVEKLWITTRPYNNIKNELEDKLSLFSYSLKPLLPKEQKGFLRKFWKAKLELNELDEQRSGVFIDELLDRLPGSIGDKDFMSIPLHAFMVAEVFKDGFKSFYDSNEKELSDKYKRKIEELDLVTLYEKFIYIKFYKIRFGEKKPGMNIDDPDMKGLIENKHKELIADHMKLALYEIFNKNEVEKLLSREEMGKVSELIDKITRGNEKAGLIERVIDSKPRFIHRTFAEYFASKLIYERLDYSKKSKQEIWEFFLDHILIDDRYNVIRRFIDCQLTDSKLFELKIGNTVEKLLEERIYKREITQLHVAAKEGLLETIKFLLNSLPNGDYINAKDNLGSTPLHYAVRNGHLEIIELLLERGGDVNAKTEMGFTPLHSAVEGLKIGHEKVVKLLLEKGADIHAKTENGQTPLERLEAFNKFYKDGKVSLIESNVLTVVKLAAIMSFYENEKVKEEYESRIFVPSEIILKSTRELFTIIISQKLDKEQKIKQFKDLIGKKGGVVGATYDGNTLLHFAAFKGYPEIIKEVIACAKQNNPDGLSNFINAEVNTLSNKATALHLAAFFGHEEVVQTLLKVDGININAKDSHGNTPIDLCYELRLLVGVDRNDHSEIINLIYNRDQNGDDINWELDELSPPIDRAVNLFKECWEEAKSLVTDLKIQLDRDEALEQLLGKAHSNSYSNIIGSLIDHNADIDSNLEGISTLFEVGTCLGRRRRRNIDNCHFSWEDVDEFNTEKDEKRDFSKIKIDGERFVSYIKDLPEEKQSQLIQLADKVKVTGESQSLVNKLIGDQKVMNHLARVGRISGITMHGMMAKNVLADFLNGDYQGVAINVGFIAGGQGFAKVAEAASFKGLKLASEGKLLLGRSLRAASPFLARGTSAFVVYDLVNQIKAFKNGTEEALVGVVGDSIYLGVDAAEIGIEIAEAFEVLEGVSSVIALFIIVRKAYRKAESTA